MAKNVAVVAGAVGIVGKHIIMDLCSRPESEWEVIAISRRKLDYECRATHVSLDLLGEFDKLVEDSKGALSKATHIFFAAYQEKPTLKEQVAPNLKMLKNLVEVVEKTSSNLVHVSLVEGTKWYGCHIGPSKTPFKEDDPRYMPPNFYYDQEDYLSSRVAGGAKWSWSGTRPNPVCGIAFGNPMNLAVGIAVYATMCKELKIPFRFPGSPGGYNCVLEVVDASLLAKGMIWAATDPKCANQAFNFSNGDVFRWSNIWKKIGDYFGVEVPEGPIMQLPLEHLMGSHDEVWANLAKKHQLREIPYKDLVMWPFVEWVLTRDYDWFADVNKARRYGFDGMTIDTGDMFLCLFDKMRKEKIIP